MNIGNVGAFKLASSRLTLADREPERERREIANPINPRGRVRSKRRLVGAAKSIRSQVADRRPLI